MPIDDSQFARTDRASSSAVTRSRVLSVPTRKTAIDRQVAGSKLNARLIEARHTDLGELKNELVLSTWSRDLTTAADQTLLLQQPT